MHLHATHGFDVQEIVVGTEWASVELSIPVREITVKAREKKPFWFSDDSDGASHFTIEPGSALNLTFSGMHSNVGLFRSPAGQVTIEVVGSTRSGSMTGG